MRLGWNRETDIPIHVPEPLDGVAQRDGLPVAFPIVPGEQDDDSLRLFTRHKP
jgi:hypothetical protein